MINYLPHRIFFYKVVEKADIQTVMLMMNRVILITIIIVGIILSIPGLIFGLAAQTQLKGLNGVTGFNPGEIWIFWTAPGADGYSGQAAGYDMRYQPYTRGPILSEAEWTAATKLMNEPTPTPAGSRDSMLITGLPEGASYYFCIKTYDAGGNYSVLSNSPLLTAGISTGCAYIPGDVNADGNVNLLDITFLINFIYKAGRAPYPPRAGDVNGTGSINILDVTALIKFLYYAGSAPVCLP